MRRIERNHKNKLIRRQVLPLVFVCLLFTGCNGIINKGTPEPETPVVSISDMPEYVGNPYVEINGNEPEFQENELTEKSFEQYSELDAYGRCGVAFANVGQDLMPTEERGNIG